MELRGEGPRSEGAGGAPNVVSHATEPLYEAKLKARGKALMAPTNPPAADAGKVAAFEWREPEDERPAPPLHALKIVGGHFVVDDHVLWAGQIGEGWWRGQATPKTAVATGGFQVTRWVPGREGPGLTEDLPALAARMVAQRTPFINTFPGLWYDRRRDEHSIQARQDANVWAPFSEMPWSRSGQGTAWDGLSKFDLSKYNPWYYARLRAFARLASHHGLVMFHSLYNTHNLLEIRPHWVDFPWRPANNINETGLPDPSPTQSASKLNVGNQFYSTENPSLRELHRKFIMHELDELGNEPNVVLSTAFQFVGPLAFQQFFQDTVAEWEKAHDQRVRLALMTTKDITDAIIEDPVRSKQIAVIDMRYWQYRPDGSLFAPRGGRNLAFRAMVRETFPGGRNRRRRLRRSRRTDKCGNIRTSIPMLLSWRRTMRSAHCRPCWPARPTCRGAVRVNRQMPGCAELATVLMTMSPRDGVVSGASGAAWCLTDKSMRHVLLYSTAGGSMTLDADLPARGYIGTWVNPTNGQTQALKATERWLKGTLFTKPNGNAWLLSLKGIQ